MPLPSAPRDGETEADCEAERLGVAPWAEEAGLRPRPAPASPLRAGCLGGLLRTEALLSAEQGTSFLLLQIFDCPRLKFSEIPQRLTALLLPPDPIVINHVIR